jgi:hypothetical protein
VIENRGGVVGYHAQTSVDKIRCMKVVVIFDKIIRPDTTGVHCESALRSIGVDVVHYAPLVREGNSLVFGQWRELPAADLYLQIDDDLAYPSPETDAPRAYWCIDVHRMENMAGGPMTRWEKIKGFGHVFSAQRDMAEKLGVAWLPLAYDPAVIHPLDGCDKVYDWCFIGNPVNRERMAAIARLRARVPNAFAGQAYGEEMNRIYNQSRVAINLSIGNDINMRFFEVQGSGTPLLSSRVGNGEEEIFDGVLYFESPEELPDRIVALLGQPELLAAAAQRQLARVKTRHTYIVRMRELLKRCGMLPKPS